MKQLHFSPKKGWLNDPNGMIYFDGVYHMFFQHYPTVFPTKEKLWGHAVSTDLVTWQELEPAILPDTPADEGGIWSGSAIEKDGVMYCFYSAIRNKGAGTDAWVPDHGQFGICLATSADGKTFIKHPDNPLIPLYPPEGSPDFRDPSLSYYNGTYYMMLAARQGLLYKSDDLIHWQFVGVPMDTGAIECPDFRPFAEKYLYIFSKGTAEPDNWRTQFCYGDFNGEQFAPITTCCPELGPHFYAPQTLKTPDGRTILIGWMYCIRGGQMLGNGTPPVEGVNGQMTIPHEITLRDGRICAFPPREVQHLLTDSDPDVLVTDTTVKLNIPWHEELIYTAGHIWQVKCYRESNMLEVFINGGEAVFCYCY